MDVGYMFIPVIIFVGGIIVSGLLFSFAMTRVEEK